MCSNKECSNKGLMGTRRFNLKISLADHTSHIGNCFIKNDVIEEMLKVTVILEANIITMESIKYVLLIE